VTGRASRSADVPACVVSIQHVWTQSRSDRRVESFARAPSRACPPGGGSSKQELKAFNRTGASGPLCFGLMAVLLLIIISHPRHRVGVAFSEGPKLLPFYENLVKWQLLPLYAHILSVTFTVLPQTHNREAGATTARRRSRWRGRTAEWTDAPFPKECVSVCRARNAGIQDREVSCS